MRDKTLSRLDRLEEVIRQGVNVPLVAIKGAGGIRWNNSVYADEKELDRAAKFILGEEWEKPIVIIQINGAESVGK